MAGRNLNVIAWHVTVAQSYGTRVQLVLDTKRVRKVRGRVVARRVSLRPRRYVVVLDDGTEVELRAIRKVERAP